MSEDSMQNKIEDKAAITATTVEPAAATNPTGVSASGEAPTPKSTTPTWVAGAWSFLGELVHVVILSLAVIVPIRYFLIQPFYVKGASMEPNFYDHEYLIIDEISYRLGQPQRGDIVVFRYPNDPSQFFIKRVIGLPGEKVTVGGGAIRISNDANPDGFILDETSYLNGTQTSGNKEWTLGSGEYFLLGDNRASSLDSRIFGPVTRDFIVGRVWFRGWPPEKIRFFTAANEIQPDVSGQQ
jgi:signal peptidase I